MCSVFGILLTFHDGRKQILFLGVGKEILHVAEFVCLGSCITANGVVEEDIYNNLNDQIIFFKPAALLERTQYQTSYKEILYGATMLTVVQFCCEP